MTNFGAGKSGIRRTLFTLKTYWPSDMTTIGTPDSKVHVAPGGPHAGPINFAIKDPFLWSVIHKMCTWKTHVFEVITALYRIMLIGT